MKKQMTLFSKMLIVLAVMGVAVTGLYFLGVFDGSLAENIAPGGNNSNNKDKNSETVTIGVVTWGGYAGGQYFNEGFEANTDSRFYKDYGFQVEFEVLDDFVASREAWKSGDVDLIWATVDAFPTEATALEAYNPKFVFQADWSRGGDAIVAKRDIETVEDLEGAKVAVAYLTPSHSFLINLIEGSNLDYSDVQIVEVSNAIDAAAVFKAGQVDAAVVWAPDDIDCVNSVNGAHILASTRSATNIIADGFFAKEEWIENNEEVLQQLYEGWMIGAAEINASEANRTKAANILSEGLNMPVEFCLDAINNVRLTTHGDNENFFGINTYYSGVTADKLYTSMTSKYKQLGFIPSDVNTYWRNVSTTSVIANSNLVGDLHRAEAAPTFNAPTQEDYTTKAIASKSISITFPTGSSMLDNNAKTVIDLSFVETATQFGGSRIRVEGNTDNTGNYNSNVALSQKRAQAVVDYLVNEYNFDANRFVVVGNGPDKAINDGVAGSNQEYRRTDFELLPN
jgi:NitT/TauT family transport system substrate-binding protein